MSHFSDVSKAVGWDKRTVAWPTLERVAEATLARDLHSLLTWNRHLPCAATPAQVAIIERVVEGVRIARGAE